MQQRIVDYTAAINWANREYVDHHHYLNMSSVHSSNRVFAGQSSDITKIVHATSAKRRSPSKT